MTLLISIKTEAPMAKMHRDAAAAFERLRAAVREGSGIDFLARCGDVLRAADFTSSKDGVADRSWHKTGRAFDYDQTSKALVIVSEPIGGKQYFRTWLICPKQDGSQGVKKSLRDYRGGSFAGWTFDFTAAARAAGFDRIPAWSGWQKNYNRREFWHYQKADGLSWAAAMAQLAGSKPASVSTAQKLIGLNDRDKNTGSGVSRIQRALAMLGYLKNKEIDGIFGPVTAAAVKEFQRSKGLDPDGLVGPLTRSAMGI